MGFLTTLFESRSAENPSTPLSAPDDWLGDALGSYKSSSGVRVNRETALTYSAIWKGTTLIAGDVGRIPTHIDKLNPQGREHARTHRAYNLLRNKPNDAMTAMPFKMTLQGHAILDGNGYAYIWRNGDGSPRELMILAPNRVTPVRYNGVLWYIYQFDNGEQRKLAAMDVIHIKGFSFDGLVGYNLIHKARESVGWAMAMQTYGAIFFRNNATPRVVLEHPSRMKADAAKNLRDSWERLHSGLENQHRTAVLEEGMKANVLSISARDAQLIDQMKFTFIDVANWLKLPPHKVGGDGRTAYASLAQENQAYLDDCLDGWLVTWEEECRDKLLTEEEKAANSHEVRFDRKQLVRANLGERNTFYTNMLQWGVYSPDMVLHEEGENAQPNGTGKVYYRPLNMAIVDQDGNVVSMAPNADAQPDGKVTDVPMPTSGDGGEPDAEGGGGAAASAAEAGSIQGTALNGAQVMALLSVADKVATGDYTPAAGEGIIKAAFPLIPIELIRKFLKELADHPIETPATASGGPGGQPSPPPFAGGEGDRERVTVALKSMLTGAVRRMVKRIGMMAERAAANPKKFGAWLDEVETSEGEVVRDNVEPLETALSAIGLKTGVADWLVQRLRSEFLELSGRCTAAELPGAAGKLTHDLIEALPAEASKEFFVDDSTERTAA